MKSDNRILAKAIADVLFENGMGQHANRLVLTSKQGSDLGGWCKRAVEKMIEGKLNQSKPNPSLTPSIPLTMCGHLHAKLPGE